MSGFATSAQQAQQQEEGLHCRGGGRYCSRLMGTSEDGQPVFASPTILVATGERGDLPANRPHTNSQLSAVAQLFAGQALWWHRYWWGHPGRLQVPRPIPSHSMRLTTNMSLLYCLFQVLWWHRDWWGLPGGLHVAAAGTIGLCHPQPRLTARAAD
jgi:hypothetical protein